MDEIAALRRAGSGERGQRVQLLVADGDALARSRLASSVLEAVAGVAVLEAGDGAEAVQLGLQRRPDIALLEIDLPRLGGVEAAVTLRELQPRMRVALRTADPVAQRERAHEHGLPLFGKLELERSLAWLQAQVDRWVETEASPGAPRKRSFVCRLCGYGALRAAAPDRCPMCHAESAWIEAARRPSRVSVTG
jgi:CheY-like chemotaxis protein